MRPYKESPVKMRAHLKEGVLFNHEKYSVKVSVKDFVNSVLRDVKYLTQRDVFKE
jgi:hypothetical protein